MIKWIVIAIIVAGALGIWTFQDDKVVIDTQKAHDALDSSRDFVNEHVEVK